MKNATGEFVSPSDRAKLEYCTSATNQDTSTSLQSRKEDANIISDSGARRPPTKVKEVSVTSPNRRPAPHLRRVEVSSSSVTIHGPPSSTGRKNNTFQRPAPMAARSTGHRKVAVIAKADDWTHWVELGVYFSGFPMHVTTKEVWDVFSREGDIITIELFEDYTGRPNGRGRVRFRYVSLLAGSIGRRLI